MGRRRAGGARGSGGAVVLKGKKRKRCMVGCGIFYVAGPTVMSVYGLSIVGIVISIQTTPGPIHIDRLV